MTDRSMKQPWWLHLIQWSTILVFAAFAVYNAQTDHGIQMAFICILIGFTLFSMLMRPLLDRRMESFNALLASLKNSEAAALDAARRFQQAIDDGFIEVIPMTPDEHPQPPTRH